MNLRDPKITALQFNQYINAQDIQGIISLMAENYTFISISGNIEKGKDINIKGWISFFNNYPDYKNIFTRVESRDNLVILIGYSTCSYDPLDGPAIWTATIEDDLVAKWQIYEDTKEIRKKLNIV
ncbi:MAG: nuclear transport factor 2 family protein [Promethearchaeota archaeon]